MSDRPTGQSLALPGRWYGRATWSAGLALFAAISLLALAGTIVMYWWWSLGGALLAGLIVLAGRVLLGDSRAGSRYRWLIIAVLVAFILRTAYVLALPYRPCKDFAVYHEAGLTMARFWTLGIAAGQDGGTFRCFFPPGQIFSLGVLYHLFDNGVLAAQILNVLYGTLTVAGVWYLAGKMFGWRAAAVAAMLAAVMPSAIFGCALIGAEVPEAFWMVAALCFYVGAVETRHSKPAAWLCGMLLGVASLIRPTFVLLAIPISLHMFALARHRRKAAVCGVLMLAGLAVVVGPWTYRNYRVTGGFILISSNGGGNLYSANNDHAKGDYTASAWQYVYDNGPNDLALQHVGFRMAKRWIVSHPLKFATLAVKKFALFWVTDKDMAWWAMTQPSQQYPALGVPTAVSLLAEGSSSGFYVVGFLMATAGLWRRRGDLLQHRAWMVIVPIFLYFTALHMVFEAQAKYHFMLMPLLCVLAAIPAAGAISAAPPAVASATGRQVKGPENVES